MASRADWFCETKENGCDETYDMENQRIFEPGYFCFVCGMAWHEFRTGHHGAYEGNKKSGMFERDMEFHAYGWRSNNDAGSSHLEFDHESSF